MAKKALPRVRYVGDGSAWVNGVPARDLTHEEWTALTDEQRKTCLSTNLYEVTGASAPGENDDGR